MSKSKELPEDLPMWAMALATVATLIYIAIVSTLVGGIALTMVLGLGYLLSRWFTLSLFQGSVIAFGACLLAVIFTLGLRITGHLEAIKGSLSSLANHRILMSGEGFDDEDEDDEE